MGSRRARRFGDSVAAAIGSPELAAEIDVDRPQILIAGAGTGRHAAMTAMRYAGANVLAIDLSMTALTYGAYQAQRLNISNLRFAQADIAGLATLDEVFDVIECMGVLHHMADPEQGWAELPSLVRPGGLMKLGLYSSHGRRFLDAAKAIIAELGLEPTISGIRATRSAVKSCRRTRLRAVSWTFRISIRSAAVGTCSSMPTKIASIFPGSSGRSKHWISSCSASNWRLAGSGTSTAGHSRTIRRLAICPTGMPWSRGTLSSSAACTDSGCACRVADGRRARCSIVRRSGGAGRRGETITP